MVLLWPGAPPLWLLVVLVAVMGAGGPGSMIGFDFARTYNPMRQIGSANGFVNTGGFIAALLGMLFVGIILDILDPGDGASIADLYSLDSFRVAFLVQYVLVGFAVAMLLHTRRRLRRTLRDEEGIYIGPLWLAIVRRIRHRGDGPGGDGTQTDVR